MICGVDSLIFHHISFLPCILLASVKYYTQQDMQHHVNLLYFVSICIYLGVCMLHSMMGQGLTILTMQCGLMDNGICLFSMQYNILFWD